MEGLREELIEKYLPLVKKIAFKIKNRLPPQVSFDDILSAGYLGLVEAANKFDPRREETFPYFAELKIRGAIYDYLRSLDLLPKEKRKKIKELERYLDQKYAESGEVSLEELCSDLGITEEEAEELMLSSMASQIESLTAPLVEGEDNYTLLSVLSSDEDPPKFLENNELFELLVKAIENLPERERLILSLYYVEGFTFKEIGKILNITESRVCQIHWRAIKRIREFLEKMGYGGEE